MAGHFPSHTHILKSPSPKTGCKAEAQAFTPGSQNRRGARLSPHQLRDISPCAHIQVRGEPLGNMEITLMAHSHARPVVAKT